MNGESTSMVWPTLGSRTAKEQRNIFMSGGGGRRRWQIRGNAKAISWKRARDSAAADSAAPERFANRCIILRCTQATRGRFVTKLSTHDTIRDASLTRAREPTRVSLI